MSKRKPLIEYIPDTFTISILLTLFVFVVTFFFKTGNFLQSTEQFGKNFWNLNTFAMQMVLILILGNTLAKTKIVSKVIDLVVSQVKGNVSALVITLFVSAVACWINWGFGLIVGALISIEIAKKIPTVNFPLLVTSAYAGFMVWHGGLSGSIPLDMATRSGVFNTLTFEFVQTKDSIFSGFNLVLILCTLGASLAVILYFSKEQNSVTLKEARVEEGDNFTSFEENKILPKIVALLGVIYLGHFFYKNGFRLSLNIICSIFLFASILLHSNIKEFLNAFNGSIKNASGIIIQFPFYAAIMGMMKVSGLGKDISQFFVDIASKDTIMVYTYLSSGLINFFVPSGGGQWAIQAPIVIPAAKSLGVPISKMAMSVAWGDAWTNIIQPFWAIPILGMAGLSVKEIFKYCFTLFLVVGFVCSIAIFLAA